MRLTYTGPSIDGVDVPLEFGGDIHCDQHKTAEFPADLAARLLEQETNWRLAPSEVAKITKAEKAADEAAADREAEHEAVVAGEERRSEKTRARGRSAQGADGDKPADSNHPVAHPPDIGESPTHENLPAAETPAADKDGGHPAKED